MVPLPTMNPIMDTSDSIKPSDDCHSGRLRRAWGGAVACCRILLGGAGLGMTWLRCLFVPLPVLTGVLVVALLAGCGSSETDEQARGPEWRWPNADLANTRRLDGAIDAQNVSRLRVAWTVPLKRIVRGDASRRRRGCLRRRSDVERLRDRSRQRSIEVAQGLRRTHHRPEWRQRGRRTRVRRHAVGYLRARRRDRQAVVENDAGAAARRADRDDAGVSRTGWCTSRRTPSLAGTWARCGRSTREPVADLWSLGAVLARTCGGTARQRRREGCGTRPRSTRTARCTSRSWIPPRGRARRKNRGPEAARARTDGATRSSSSTPVRADSSGAGRCSRTTSMTGTSSVRSSWRRCAGAGWR